MNEIAQKVEAIVAMLRETDRLFDTEYVSHEYLRNRSGPIAQEYIALKSMVLRDGSFGQLRDGVIRSPTMVRRLDENYLPLTLLSAAQCGDNIKYVLRDIRAFAKSRNTTLLHLYILPALHIKKPLRISPRIRIANLDSERYALEKHALGYQITASGSTLGSAMFSFGSAFECAIEIETEERIELSDTFSEDPPFDAQSAQFFKKQAIIDAEANDVVRCIFLSTFSSLRIAGSFQIAKHRGASPFFLKPIGFNRDDIFGIGLKPRRVEIAERDAIRRRFGLISKMAEKDVLRRAIDRLLQAASRRNIVDQAIDLGIALEVLLLHGKGVVKDELSFRIALHGSLYISKTRGGTI